MRLFLEQRVGIVRKRLNEDTLRFQDRLPVELQREFKQWVLDCMNVLDGFAWDLTNAERERFHVPPEPTE